MILTTRYALCEHSGLRGWHMRKHFLAVAVVAGLASWAASGDIQNPDFDNSDPAPTLLKEAQARSKDSDSPADRQVPISKSEKVWASFDRADIGEDFPLKTPVEENDLAAVYQVEASELPAISGYMHEKFNRCAGFFAHRTRAEAEKDLSAPPAAAVGESYTIDQQAWAKPLV